MPGYQAKLQPSIPANYFGTPDLTLNVALLFPGWDLITSCLSALKLYPAYFSSCLFITNRRLGFDDKNPLYGGFCTLTTELHIHFQPTLRYVERNVDALPEVTGRLNPAMKA